MRETRFIELFAGIAGFRYGIEEAINAIQGGRREGTSPRRDMSELGSGNKRWGRNSKSPDGNREYESESERAIGSRGKPKGDIPRIAGRGKEPEQEQGHRIWGKRQDIRCVWANEIDRYASSIYRYHYGGICEGDIRAIDPSAVPKHELLCAGFPCQSFSIAGQRRGFLDTRGTLFYEICRIAGAKGTPYLLLENVKGLLSAPYTEAVEEWGEGDFDAETGEPTSDATKKHRAIAGTKGWVFLTILDSLCELGYDCQWEVLNSKNFGVPQNRERVFIVCHLRGQRRPKVFPLGENDGRIAEGVDETTSVRTLQGGGHSGGHHSGMTLLQVGLVNKKDNMGQRIYDVEGIATSLRSEGGGQGAKTGLYEVKPVLTPARAKKRQHGRRMKTNNEPMFALTGQDIHGVEVASCLDQDGYLRAGERPRDNDGRPQLLPVGYRRIRRLTPRECERLQGFPDDWTRYGIDKNGKEIEISDTQRYKCCGNAVTTNVIEEIATRLLGEIIGQD